MALTFSKAVLADGVNFLGVTDTRFKTNHIAINILTELSADTASANAIIPAVLSKSNSSYPSVTEINRKLSELYGANISGDVFKLGDSQCFMLTGNCIDDKYTLGGEKITRELTELLIDCLFSPNIENGGFSSKNFALNKQELIDDIDAEINEKRSYAMLRAGKKIFEGEPAAVSSHGDREHALALTESLAYEQYKKILETAQIEIFFVGGGNPDDAREKFATAFSSLKRSFSGKLISQKSVLKGQVCDVTETLDIAQSKMVMAFKTECEDASAMRVMNAIFGTTPSSKLFVNVREKLSLCYYCAAGFDEQKGVLMVDSGVEQENTYKARAEIINQLGEVAAGNFTDEEMENALLSRINGHRSINDSPYSIASWYFMQAYKGTSLTPEEEIERMKKVTREDITQAAASLTLDTVYILTGKGGEQK